MGSGVRPGGLGSRLDEAAHHDVSSAKAREVLGWQPRSLEETVVAMGETMIRYCVVRARGRRGATRQVAPAVQEARRA